MPLEVGAVAPDFILRNQNNQEIRLSDLRLSGLRVLVVFFPFAFTGICQGELAAVRDNLGEFQNDAVQILSISTDTVYSLKTWALREGYDFPLLSDFWPHGAVARSYGVFNERNGSANRGTFLVDSDGVVRFAEMNGPGEPRDQDVWRKALTALDSGDRSTHGLAERRTRQAR